MNLTFLHKTSGDKVIVIFAGWSTTPRFYSELNVKGWDLAVVYGTDMTAPDFGPLRRYPIINVYAWSMGVYFAERFWPRDIHVAAMYAAAGTPWPCDDARGIPEAIFRATSDTLSPANMRRFWRRMCGGTAALQQVSCLFEDVDTGMLANQLQSVADCPIDSPSLPWNRAYVPKDDTIFPPAAQANAWDGICPVIELDSPHVVPLQKILSHTAVDVSRVGERFAASLDTYSDHAHAQRVIARHLGEILAKNLNETGNASNVLEIGCGTGLFTKIWHEKISPDCATFVDLCEVGPFHVAPCERYIKGDAERVVEKMASDAPDSFDAILSSSAIQWFSHPERFFANCLRLLRQEGVLCVSTFAPGNLSELLALRPDPLPYRTCSELASYLTGYQGVEVYEGKVEIDFTTPLEALRHLRLTGVAGSAHQRGAKELMRFVRQYPVNENGRYSLTFRPIYIVAKKK